jgi:hypothetical protein
MSGILAISSGVGSLEVGPVTAGAEAAGKELTRNKNILVTKKSAHKKFKKFLCSIFPLRLKSLYLIIIN